MPCIYSLVTSSTRREKLFKWLSRVIVAQLTISTLQILARLQFNVNVSYKLWYCQTTLFALNWKAIPCQWTIHWHCVKVHNIAGNVRKFKMCKIDLVTIYKRQTITFLCFVLLRKCCRYQALQTNITDIDIQYISMISQKRCWSEKNKVTTVHCLHQTHTSIYLCWPITSLEIARNLMSLKNWSIPLHISPVVCRLHLPSVIIDLLPAEGILVFHITSSDYVPTQQKSTQCQCAASYYQGWDLYHI